MTDAVCLGELLIDFVPTITGTSLVDAPAFKKAAGGAPANVAVGLSRLGATAAFMGKVGDDAFGHFLADTLAAYGVDVGPLLFTDKARTALAFVSLHADGEREFLFYRHPSADMLFAAEDVDVDLIRRAKLLHFGSIGMIDEPCRSAALLAVTAAQDAGLLISYDPNLRLALWPDAEAAKAGMMLAWPKADIIKVSEEELEFLTGESDPVRAGRRLWHDQLRLLVVTCGVKGCFYLTPEFEGEVAGVLSQGRGRHGSRGRICCRVAPGNPHRPKGHRRRGELGKPLPLRKCRRRIGNNGAGCDPGASQT